MCQEKGGFIFPFILGFNRGGKWKGTNTQNDPHGFVTHSVDLLTISKSQFKSHSCQFKRVNPCLEFQLSQQNKKLKKQISRTPILWFLPMNQVVGKEVELIRSGFLAVISGLGMELGKVKTGVQELKMFDGAKVGLLREAVLSLKPKIGAKVPSRRKQKKLVKWQHKQARAHYDQGMEHVRNLRLKQAIKELELAVELEPNNVEYLAQLSKQWTDYTYVPETPADVIREYNRRAIKLAEKCIDIDPSDPLGYIALCAGQGRLALYSDNRTKAKLAKSARSMADLAVQMGPDFDFCHLIQGTWNYEMAGLNMVVRAIIRVVFGTNLAPGSYQDAIACFKRAEALNPSRLITQVQLGKAYVKLGMEEECIKCLQHSFELEYDDINGHLERITAYTILKELRPDLNIREYYDEVPPHSQQ
eukprot:TRINITY_DN52780_c0_g1_i2.p1 TRINITY_DN52780_c0_g1~~TRINITY_DN52780_c0_g1_i2.p1  ORF type:complete len:417 (+),score=58.37 TRINITY_DN52780_c0_g1_i2:286-1536(+)